MNNTTEYELLFSACEIVAARKKIKLIKPSLSAFDGDLFDFIDKLAEVTGIQIRKIALTDSWWQKDHGPLLGFYQNRPCALLPKKFGGYQLIDVHKGRCIKVTPKIITALDKYVFNFYPSFPENMQRLTDLYRFAFRHIGHDFRWFVGIQILITLIALAVPMALTSLFRLIIPNMDWSTFTQMLILLGTAVVVVALFQITQASLRIRMHFKLEATIAPAVWNRILKFPLVFFRHFSVGDLTFRAEIVNEILSSSLQSVWLLLSNGLLSILLCGVLVYYNADIGIIAIGLALFIAMMVGIAHYRQSDFLRRFYNRLSASISLVAELIAGISKIRVADATGRAYQLWAKMMVQTRTAELEVKSSESVIEIFIMVITVVNPLILYAAVQWREAQLSFSAVIGIIAVYSWLFLSWIVMAKDVGTMMRALPLWQRARPIFTTEVERQDDRVDPGQLTGDIHIKNITFRYHSGDLPLFRDFSLQIHPGEFVAIVGPSGSGKSTLFRLMLGFEEPETGEIQYNGFNLQALKLSAVREQIGVVIQNSSLIPGTIFTNIAGNYSHMSRIEAWEIAEKVGLAELIKSLPMQMDTLITEGAVTLSGGEVQRLILARALAQQPKIIILDEATSALDNTTQAMVHHYLKQLQATQIVAAHRLSTIMNADRIIVLEKGEIAQTGRFDELISTAGLFAQMARRQL